MAQDSELLAVPGTAMSTIYRCEIDPHNVHQQYHNKEAIDCWDPDLPGHSYESVSCDVIYEELQRNIVPEAYCTNCVSTFDLGVSPLNLERINQEFSNTRMDPHRFSAAIAKFINPSATLLLFRSGSVVCTGPKSPLLSLEAVYALYCLLKRHNIPAEMRSFKIQNMVFVAMTKRGIDIARISTDYNSYVNYEPNLFPGCVLRLSDIRRKTARATSDATKIVINMFCSGKIVLTGAKSVQEAMQVHRWLCLYIIGDRYTIPLNMNSSTYAAQVSATIPCKKLERYMQSAAAAKDSARVESYEAPAWSCVTVGAEAKRTKYSPSERDETVVASPCWIDVWRDARKARRE